jgi:fumarate reductase flavoprotein subunit
MMDKVGIFRNAEDLASAVKDLEALLVRSKDIHVSSTAPGPNPELVSAYRLKKMLKLALCIAMGAAERTESRGAHYREDYPQRNDKDWLKRTIAVWKSPNDTRPTLSYEAMSVMKMELPPGFRGYGAKNYIEHPDTARREQEIEALKAKLGPNADRYAIQQALMPFEQLLPERLRGKNQRLGEEHEKGKRAGGAPAEDQHTAP